MGQREVLEHIGRGIPLPQALDAIARLVESQTERMFCSILLLDAERGCVRRGAAPSLPPEFIDRLDGLAIGPHAGSCGAAAYLKERVIVEDIAVHPNWAPYRHLAMPHGLRACWSSPILSPEHDVLGTLAMYYTEPRAPSERDLRWVELATHLASIVMVRDRAEQERLRLLHSLEERCKELTLLHRATRLLQPSAILDRRLFQELVSLIPTGWQFPESCVARVRWQDIEAESPNWQSTPWTLRADFEAAGGAGSLEVSYLKVEPEQETFPFPPEERDLLRSVADLLATWLGRQAAEEELRRSEERLRAVIDNTPDVAIQWYDREARLLSFNPTSRRLFGWDDSALGKTLLELRMWSSGEEARFRAAISAVDAGLKVEPTEFSYLRSDGSEGYLLSTIFPLPTGSGPPCYVCMDIDLTDRRRLEQQLGQSQRLTALGTLAGGIAHDFNNILAAIRGNADVAVHHLDRAHPALESVQEIQAAADRAALLVKQILMFGRKQIPNREAMDLQTAVEEVLRLLRVSIPRSIELVTRFSPSVPKVLADATQVHQVVLNLVTNASQSIEKNGRIEISLEPFAADANAPSFADLALGDYALLTVSDDGIGMDESTLRRVFEPFFTTKPSGQGTGLGLSVVHGIMKAHGGTVEVSSQPGRGSTFRLFFPAHRPSLPERSAAPNEAIPTGGRVLFVDDDEALAFLAQRMLSRQGFSVTAHSDPACALEEFKNRISEFDVVVTDISMPGLSGSDLVANIRALRADLPIVMITGAVKPEHEATAARLGNVEVVLKPTTMDGYMGLLAPLIRGRRDFRAPTGTADILAP